MKCLLIEDDAEIATMVRQGLNLLRYEVECASEGKSALELVAKKNYDIIVTDLLIPGVQGQDIIRHLRSVKNEVPVLVISALNETGDRIKILSLGADDYLPKPFSIVELQLRVGNLIRRSHRTNEQVEIEVQGVKLNRLRREATRDGKILDLQDREYRLLELFMSYPDRIITKRTMLSYIWGYDFDPNTNIVDVLVCRLRSKVDKDFAHRMIYTIRGVGYIFRTASSCSLEPVSAKDSVNVRPYF